MKLLRSRREPLTHTPMPSGGRLGGHLWSRSAMTTPEPSSIVRNSWGTKVLDHGYFYMRYSYVASSTLASDLWTIRTIEA